MTGLGEAKREYGNIELSYEYLVKRLKCFDDIKSMKMLDIGTNIGSLPFMTWSRNGYDMSGVECREAAISMGKKEYPEIANKLFVVGNCLSEFEDESYDIVTMFDVIEHIPDVEVYLKEDVFRILRRGGILIFQTPNKRINPIFEIISHKSFTAYKKYHCSLQTPSMLRKMLTTCGFEEIVIEKYTLDSEYNRIKLSKYFGPLAKKILKIFALFPLAIYPNLWGSAIKP